MDTRQLAAFCAVVERKSFSQAAERLGVTQPAVSLQIRSLEQRLGRQLLDRSGRGGAPTRAGRRPHGWARRAPQQAEEVVLAVPAAHPFAGKTVSLEQLRTEPLIVMQEGAGVRQVIEDELRKADTRLRDLDVQLELGLQESVRSAVLAGHGITFISRLAIEADISGGAIATARVRGLDPVREILLARASGRSETRAARAFVAYAREHLPS